jgi:HK97 family phage major capsid protein
MFVEKSLEEVSKMTLQEQQDYMTAKAAHEAETRKTEIAKAIEEAQKNNVSKEDIEKLTAKQSEIIKEIERLGLETKASKEASKGQGQGGTMAEAIEKALLSVQDDINKAVAGKQDTAIKAVVTMQVDNTIGSGATQVTITDNTGIVSAYRKREMRYLANVSVGRTSGNRALWIEQTAEDGTPIMLGEGDAKTQLSSIWQEKTAEVKKIAVYGKVSTELMADIPQLVSYIQNNLMKRLDIVLENQLISGNNTGDNLNGANNLATAFSAGTLANTITTPNDYDVVAAVALQSELAFGVPNGIFVNPAIVTRMKLTKDSTGAYVMPTFTTTNGLEVAGMRVIPTTALSGENFLGGDLTVLNVLIREELGIQIGLDGNDFTNNKKTMLIEKRLVQFASANDVACLIKGAFNTAKALLATT